MLRVSSASGFEPILDTPFNSSCKNAEVTWLVDVVAKRCITKRSAQQPALYSKPARPSTSRESASE